MIDKANELKQFVASTLTVCTEDERRWCDDKCIERWITGIPDLNRCKEALCAALLWRSKYQPHKIPDDYAASLNSKGKIYVVPNAVDREGYPVVVIRLRQDSSGDAPVLDRLRLIVYTIEKCCGLNRKNYKADKVGLIVDLKDVCIGNMDRQLVTEVLRTMQANYVEQLAFSYMINAPFVFNTFFKIFSAFIDENTKSRISVSGSDFIKYLDKKIDVQNIPKEFGGNLDFDFEVEKYTEFVRTL